MGWHVPVDPAIASLYRLLKPGAAVGIIDHAALPGSGSDAAQSLHRIDPQFVCEEMRRMGFEFVAASDLLRNPRDDLVRPVFEPELRGLTSRFVHRYRKPAIGEPLTPPADCGRSGDN